ncbi:uncharacterized protein LOC135683011 [Rhopilema esculentum]|uniref:uncharacterized protein LOC135683011 n=1 Tax=Rhopilema esculentum TaxID=499914 RepID=UPI0031D865D7
MRMNTETFEELLSKVRHDIEEQTTHLRTPISTEEKLAVTLRFLGTGEIFESLQYQFRIHQTSITKFVPLVCDAIYNNLKVEYFHFPTSEAEWIKLAQGAEEKWQFPNAFGAADGFLPIGNTSHKVVDEKEHQMNGKI